MQTTPSLQQLVPLWPTHCMLSERSTHPWTQATKLIHKMRRARAGNRGSASGKALGQGDEFAIIVDAARQQDKLRRDKEAAIVPVSTDAKVCLSTYTWGVEQPMSACLRRHASAGNSSPSLQYMVSPAGW